MSRWEKKGAWTQVAVVEGGEVGRFRVTYKAEPTQFADGLDTG